MLVYGDFVMQYNFSSNYFIYGLCNIVFPLTTLYLVKNIENNYIYYNLKLAGGAIKGLLECFASYKH